MDDRSAQIRRAKELLATARHASMATVNNDGSPHNTPFFLLLEPDLSRLYWGSHPDSQHSQNIARTGQLFVVIYDLQQRGGLYIQARNGHITDGEELDRALAVHNSYRARETKAPLMRDYYSGSSSQRMWSAEPTHFWVNGTERDTAGLVIQDIRTEISSSNLL